MYPKSTICAPLNARPRRESLSDKTEHQGHREADAVCVRLGEGVDDSAASRYQRGSWRSPRKLLRSSGRAAKTRLGEPERQARSPDSQAVDTQRVQALTRREPKGGGHGKSGPNPLCPRSGLVVLIVSSSAPDPTLSTLLPGLEVCRRRRCCQSRNPGLRCDSRGGAFSNLQRRLVARIKKHHSNSQC